MTSEAITVEALCARYDIQLCDSRTGAMWAVGDTPSCASVAVDASGAICIVRRWDSEKTPGYIPMDVAVLHELMHIVFSHPIHEFRVTEMVMFGAEVVAAALLGLQERALYWQHDTDVRIGAESYFGDVDIRKRAMLMKYSFMAAQELGVLDAEFRLTYRRAEWSGTGQYTRELLDRDTEIDYDGT